MSRKHARERVRMRGSGSLEFSGAFNAYHPSVPPKAHTRNTLIPPMAAPKKKSGEKSGAGELVDGPRGGKLRRGSQPGNTPGTGRPPNEFRDRMRVLASRIDVETYLDECLQGKFGPMFYLKALQFAADRGYGKPVQAVEVTGADGAPLFKSFLGVNTEDV